MDGFPLSELHYNLLGKIAGKLEKKSYFRMQQTCCGMAELFRNNRGVKVMVDKQGYMAWKEAEDGLPRRLLFEINGITAWEDEIELDLESIYGVKFDEFAAPWKIKEGFEEYCLELKKHRITCITFDFEACNSRITKEQTIELVKILKPAQIKMESRGSKRFEALTSCENLESVKLYVNLANALPALQITSGIPDVLLYLDDGLPYDGDDIDSGDEDAEDFNQEKFCQTFKRVFEFFRSAPLSSFHRFRCIMYYDDEEMSMEECIALLNDYQPIRSRRSMTGARGERCYRCTVSDRPVKVTLTRCEMDGFPLSELHYNLLGKIAGKLEKKSYFRMQQTCRGMAELFRNNRKVKVMVDKQASMKWKEAENGLPRQILFEISGRTIWDEIEIDMDSVYGVKFGEISPPRKHREGFELCCSELKKRRVTCNTFNFLFPNNRITKEQTIELIKILKPTKIRMESRRSNRFEALASCENLKSIDLHINLVDALSALQIISEVSNITLFVRDGAPYDVDDSDYEDDEDDEKFDKKMYCQTFNRVFEYIRSVPLSRLHRFRCVLYCERELMSMEERVQLLDDFLPTDLETSVYDPGPAMIHTRFPEIPVTVVQSAISRLKSPFLHTK